ncbi:MAG TPA: TonB-dependent receptor [Polyangiales bacterium]
MSRRAASLALLLSWCASRALAEERAEPALSAATDGASEYGARATSTRTRLAATHGEDPTATGTSLDLTDRVSLPRSLADVVREAPGTRVINSGGLGAFSTLSLRGADGEETQVLLDEIPLSMPDGGAFDLSLFPAELFERVDVFRGGAPVWLGSGAIAGVLRLVPRRPAGQAARASIGAGSFGSWQLSGGAAVGADDVARVRSQLVVRGAQNDFPYHDDRGTVGVPSDDIELRRKNAQLTDGTGLVDLNVPLGKGGLHIVALGHGRTGGFAGPGSAITPNIHRSSQRALLGVSYERSAGGGGGSPRRRIQLVGSGSYLHSRYTDLYGELGLTQRWDTNDHAYRGFLRAAGSLRIVRWLEATLVASYGLDQYRLTNRYSYPKLSPTTRHGVAGALELAARGKLGPVRLELRPSARVEWSHTRIDADEGLSGPFDPTQRVLLPTARVGVGVSPIDDLSFTASFASGGRLPTMSELFGDRATTLPSPDLKPVRGLTYDVGATYCTSGAVYRASLEVHGFLQQRRDMIVGSLDARKQQSFHNVSQVEQKGVELGGFGALWDHLLVHASMTYLHTETQLDKRLPLRPTWVMYARPELRTRIARGPVSSLGGGAELSYRSFVFVNPSNLEVLPECGTAAISVAFGFLRERIKLVGRMDDVADVRCSDLLGYPLPGRSLFFTLSYQEESS